MRRAVVLVFAAACGDNEAPDGDIGSGSRLRLITYVYGDGTREWDRNEFHDAERDEACVPATFSDGLRYCMPASAGGGTQFVDDKCTQVVGHSATEEPPPYFIRSFTLGASTLPSRLYRSGAPIETPALAWEQRDGFCLAVSVHSDRRYFEVGEEIGHEELVHIREASVIEGSRIGVGIDTTSDGLRIPGHFYDLAHDQECTAVARANASIVECEPRAMPQTSYYADARCSEPVLATAEAPPARVRHRDPVSECLAIHPLLGPHTGALYELLAGSCVVVPPPTGLTLYATGDAEQAARMQRESLASPTRLTTIDLVDELLRVSDRFLFDQDLGAECERQELDGELACVPRATVTARVAFADDQCTTQLRIALVPTTSCAPVARFASDEAARYPVIAPVAQPLYELEPGDRCGTYAAPSRYTAYALGDAIDTATLPRATRVID